MEKDIIKLQKNPETEIIVRIDDFGGRAGVTIREFVKSERYTGFTKAGTRISVDNFKVFKDAINSISDKDLEEAAKSAAAQPKKEYTPNNSFGSGAKKDFSGKSNSGGFAKKKEVEMSEDESAF